MALEDRLDIVHAFELNGQPRHNRLKMVEYDQFVQVFIKNGKTADGKEKYAQMRLDKQMCEQVQQFLSNIQIK